MHAQMQAQMHSQMHARRVPRQEYPHAHA
jgi:hypothetical protein